MCCKLVRGVALSSGVIKEALKEAKKKKVDIERVISFMTSFGLSNSF